MLGELLTSAAQTQPDKPAFLADRLAEWKLPASIAVVPDLPIGPTGKVQRRLLRERMTAAAAALTR